MAHFAEIDTTTIIDGGHPVLRVIVVGDSDTSDDEGVEREELGAMFCADLLGGTWVQTSYNESFRNRFAAIGGIWRDDIDSFILKQPYPSWTLNESTGTWQAPTDLPSGDEMYDWDEESLSWIVVEPSPDPEPPPE